jgi:hypothetical protein
MRETCCTYIFDVSRPHSTVLVVEDRSPGLLQRVDLCCPLLNAAQCIGDAARLQSAGDDRKGQRQAARSMGLTLRQRTHLAHRLGHRRSQRCFVRDQALFDAR